MIVDKTSVPTAGGSNDDPSPPPYEAAILTDPVNHLHRSMTVYRAAEEAGREPTKDEVHQVAAAMRDVGDHHPDPKAKGEWHRRAEKFMRATKPVRRGILREAGGIIGVLLFSIPCVLLGTALHVAGGAIHAAGSALGGLGDFVTGNSSTEGKIGSYLGRRSPLGHAHAHAGSGRAAQLDVEKRIWTKTEGNDDDVSHV